MRDRNGIKKPTTFVLGRPKCHLLNVDLMATCNEENYSMENIVWLGVTVLSDKQFIEMY